MSAATPGVGKYDPAAQAGRSLAEIAGDVAENYPVFPVLITAEGEKRPVIRWRGTAEKPLEPGEGAVRGREAAIALFKRFPGANAIGVPTGWASGLLVPDFDTKNGGGGDVYYKANQHRFLRTRLHRTRSGGGQMLLNMPPDIDIRNSAGKLAKGVDIRANGGYIVWPGSPGYSVIDDAPVADCPEWFLADLLALKPKAVDVSALAGTAAADVLGAAELVGDGTVYGLAALRKACAAIVGAEDGTKHDTLNREAYSIGGLVSGGEINDAVARAALDAALGEIAGACRDYGAAQATLRQAYAAGKAKPRHEATRKAGQAVADFAGVEAPALGHNGGPPLDDAVRPAESTEDAVALAFSARHAGVLRYVATWGAWLVWDGARWRRDELQWVRDLARAECRLAASRAEQKPISDRLSKAATVTAVERLAQADRRHARGTDGWDADPYMLNTPGGVVDLRTGALLPHDPDLAMTKVAGFAPAVSADCPLWLRFLDEVTRGDVEYVRFIQRMCGYALTGITREHAVFFGYGPGGNGKSVLLNVLSAVAGDYASAAGMETFTATKHERHLTELARLQGARVVTATETEEGRSWAEAKIKQLTGGDPITANFMRQDHFTFVPQFKVFIAGNHKPRLRNVDEAARRRFHLLPFLHRPAAPDKDLEAKLRAEGPAILRWMIEGCLEWQRIGLAPPGAVREATAEYFAAEDAVARWMEDCCDSVPEHFETHAALFTSFQNWAGARREALGNERWLRERLEAIGLEKHRRPDARGFKGLRIRPPAATASPFD
jgi:P4 family phage/plasmid primase-like protien